MLIIRQDVSKIRKLKEDLSMSFDMKDLEPTKQILGIQNVQQEIQGVWLSQERYIE